MDTKTLRAGVLDVALELHGARGRAGLVVHRREFAHPLWQKWSPGWSCTGDEFDSTAISFEKPDFGDVHSYRHRYNLVPEPVLHVHRHA